MTNSQHSFSKLRALFLNCSLKADKSDSHTQLLLNRAAAIMEAHSVSVEHKYPLEHNVAFGMFKDGASEGIEDGWPKLQQAIMAAHILVIGTPIWLGVKSSVATQVIERMYAYSGDTNNKGQYLYYGKVGGCIVTGNEDGIKHCAMDILYALSHMGYMIPPQADAGWIGEAGPGPSYGDRTWRGEEVEGGAPAGFKNEFTNRNTTFMAWNLMHTAEILRKNDGLPDTGNTSAKWREVTNAEDVTSD